MFYQNLEVIAKFATFWHIRTNSRSDLIRDDNLFRSNAPTSMKILASTCQHNIGIYCQTLFLVSKFTYTSLISLTLKIASESRGLCSLSHISTYF